MSSRQEESLMSKLSRASFLKTAGIATGAAMVGGVPAAAAAAEGAPEIVAKPAAMPRQPLVAYVRDAAKGEVTVVSGLQETTFKDPALVKKMTKAAQRHPKKKTRGRGSGGVI
jgi:hypothetical protein